MLEQITQQANISAFLHSHVPRQLHIEFLEVRDTRQLEQVPMLQIRLRKEVTKHKQISMIEFAHKILIPYI